MSPGSIGAELEWVRLTRRAQQLDGVLVRLRLRVRAADAGDVERSGLRRALGDFDGELRLVHERLDVLAASLDGSEAVLARCPGGTAAAA